MASNRPLPVANEDVIEKANAGKTETINVLANDFNPFSDTPLRIVSATVETGSAAGQPAVAGDSITVTPADGFKGVMVLRYTVHGQDRRRLPADRRPGPHHGPGQAGRPLGAVRHGRAQPDRGAQVGPAVGQRRHHQQVHRRSNGFSQDCATTTCTLSGLTNDVKYVFTVTATNEVGESAAVAGLQRNPAG